MKNIEKDLDKVAGGIVVESKDGKFFCVDKSAIGSKVIESKDGKFFVVNDKTLSFNTESEAKWNDIDTLDDRRWELYDKKYPIECCDK